MIARVLPPLLFIAAVLAFASAADGSDSDDRVFTEGDFEYMLIGEEAVEVSEYAPVESRASVEIPAYVAHEGTEYVVVGIGCIFNNEGITSVSIPEFVSWIDYPGVAFSGSGIEEIKVDPSNRYFESVDGILFDDKMREILRYPCGKAGDGYAVPDSVVIVGESAFSGARLKSVDIPYGVMEIGGSAFYGCSELYSLNNIGEYNVLPQSLTVMEPMAFYGCAKLKSLILSSNLKVIGEFSFQGSGITSITIPGSVLSIGVGAFASCEDLAELESDGTRYESIDGSLYEVQGDGLALIAYPAGNPAEVFIPPEKMSDIESYAFSGAVHLKEVMLPKTMTALDFGSFIDCRSLERIDLSNVAVIGTGAFLGCENLKEIVFGESLYSIESMALSGIAAEEISLPSSLRLVEIGAFRSSPNLRTVAFGEDCKAEIGAGAFLECLSLEQIEFHGDGIVLDENSLDIGTKDNPMTVTIIKDKGLDIPEDAAGEYTELDVRNWGERPYPYENFIGVAICILVLLGIIWLFRGVRS